MATREHAERVRIQSGMHVLEIGCGLGGASRHLAAECGCRVAPIDLTPNFVEVARILTARCGLAGRVEIRQANAFALPFQDGTFDQSGRRGPRADRGRTPPPLRGHDARAAAPPPGAAIALLPHSSASTWRWSCSGDAQPLHPRWHSRSLRTPCPQPRGPRFGVSARIADTD